MAQVAVERFWSSDLGESIPAHTEHAVSVSLPKWADNVAYEEGQPETLRKLQTGYPRFVIQKPVVDFKDAILRAHGSSDQDVFLYPSRKVAEKCQRFLLEFPNGNLDASQVCILEFTARDLEETDSPIAKLVSPTIYAVLLPVTHYKIAKQYWQHAGDGISGRRAEYCHSLFKAGKLVLNNKAELNNGLCKGPRRYRRAQSTSEAPQTVTPDIAAGDPGSFLEERFGRNLNVALSNDAKEAIKRRIAGSLSANVELRDAVAGGRDQTTRRPIEGFSENDVYLYQSGMSAIYNTHQCLLAAKGQIKSVSYGFPYVDTLKILEKFGPGVYFYGHGSEEDLDDLEAKLKAGHKVLGLFCEFPGNPLLKSPDLVRIRRLADEYDFAVVVDETIGNILNVHVLPYADVVVSSLTKLFSGDANVMGGSAILNPTSKLYSVLKKTWEAEYEDLYWAEDAIFMERNSRDFVSRSERVNQNAEAICTLLQYHPKVREVYYPKVSPTRKFFDVCRNEKGGYGGLLSAVFKTDEDAVRFYDALDVCKGPSLGTNFTLASPFVILAHFGELEWAASYGADPHLLRFSMGLEDTDALVRAFEQALAVLS